MPRFAVSVVAEAPAHTIHAARAAEENGFDLIYVGDIQSTHRELYTSLTLIASNTSRIILGSGVTNPITRHPAVTAGAIATLDEVAPGRVFLGIGTGDSAVHNISERAATLAELEEYVDAIKRMWAQGETQYRGKMIRGRMHHAPVPVLMTAHGPKAFATAGRIAESVVAGIGMTPDAVSFTLESIAKGSVASGSAARDLDVWYLCYPHVGDGDLLKDEVGAALAAGGNILAKSASAVTIPDRYRLAMTELAAGYDYSVHMNCEPNSFNSTLVRELRLIDFLVDRFGLIGTPAEIAERLREHGTRGVTNYWCVYSRPDLGGHIDRWGASVIETAPA